ncbi:MAG TPA: glycosyltransferase family 4 protein, partial [Dehalococcoidia bacterium]
TYTDELRKRHDALASDVDWLGRLSSEEIDKLYMTHDVAVVPSTWEEPFGLVALEAMAAGLPVIATQSGGLTEIVRPHFNGALVPRNNAVALGEALLTFASNKELVREYGRNAAGDVKTRFDADRMASKARAFLELVAGRA